MCTFFRDVLKLELVQHQSTGTRFRLSDGTEVHVYGTDDADHDFFGAGPVVGFAVESFASARAYMAERGADFVYPEPQRGGGRAWQHFRGADGNIYELIGPDDLDRTDRVPRRELRTLVESITIIDGWRAPQARDFFRNAWPMYVHEITGYSTDFYRLDATGRWLPDIVEHWISDVTPPANLRVPRKDSDSIQPFQRAHVIAVDGVPVGFACVALQPFKYMPEDVDLIVSEFFLVRGRRGTGVARRALELLMERYPGRWYLRAIHDNLRAIQFWRKTLPSVGARHIRERPIDGDIVWECSVGQTGGT